MSVEIYKSVMADVESGKRVSRSDLEVATAFAKAKRRKQPKGAIVKRAYNKQSGTCSGVDTVDGVEVACDRDAKTRDLCMKHYVRKYRTNPVNAEKARQASRNYAAKQREAKQLANA